MLDLFVERNSSLGDDDKKAMAPMKIHELINPPFPDFDWTALDQAEFKEDSVRELLIAPLLRTLGYRESGRNKVVRSKRLEHPFVSIGTTQRRISLVPDYLMYVDQRPAWILDAKSPSESVLDRHHEEQAYSYACHRDVRVEWYAVCNGFEFAAFHVGDMSHEPRFRFSLVDLTTHFDTLWQALAPTRVHTGDDKFNKDFGIHLQMMGMSRNDSLGFAAIKLSMVARVGESTYSTNAVVKMDEQNYAVTFDFDADKFRELLTLVPEGLKNALASRLTEIPSLLWIEAEDHPQVAARVRLSAQILENANEHYLPLEIDEFYKSAFLD